MKVYAVNKMMYNENFGIYDELEHIFANHDDAVEYVNKLGYDYESVDEYNDSDEYYYSGYRDDHYIISEYKLVQ